TITLVSAIFALLAKDPQRRLLLVAYIPTTFFWGLDAYFLHQEKLYRSLYDSVRQGLVPADYSLKVVNPTPVSGWLTVIWNKTLVAFYGMLLVTILVVMNVM